MMASNVSSNCQSYILNSAQPYPGWSAYLITREGAPHLKFHTQSTSQCPVCCFLNPVAKGNFRFTLSTSQLKRLLLDCNIH